MSVSYELNSIVIDDWVKECDPIPITDRNRNYEPILSGITLQLKESYPNSISIGDSFEFFIDSVGHYSGIVRNITSNTDKHVYDLQIEHKLFGLTRILIDESIIGGTAFSLNTVDFTTTLTVDNALHDPSGTYDQNYIYIAAGHGLSEYDLVGFKIVGGEDYELIGERYFYVHLEVPPAGVGTTAQWAQLRKAPNMSATYDYTEDLATELNGSLMSAVVDTSLYNAWDIDNLPNLNIQHLFDVFAHLCGVTFDYTDIAGYFVHSIDAETYELHQLCLDVNMMYALGQSSAVPYEVIAESTNVGSKEEDYFARRLKTSELFSYLMSLFGFSIHYIGSDTYEILKPSNSLYSFLPKEFYKKVYTTINGQINTSFGKESWTERIKYTTVQPVTYIPYPLDQGYQMNAVKDTKENNINDVNYISNLKILLRLNTGDVEELGSTLSVYYFRIDQSTEYRIDAIENNYQIQKIESPVKTGTYTILNHKISQSLTTGLRSIITQEDII